MSDIEWQEIQQLLQAFDDSAIAELSLEANDFKLSLKKATLAAAPVAGPLMAQALPAAAVTSSEPAPPAGPHPDWIAVTSPMVGTFYAAPAPEEPVFVRQGDRVEVGQTVCIIEAMKLMNEIDAELNGRVAEIMVSNSQPVEYGQVLMYIDPT